MRIVTLDQIRRLSAQIRDAAANTGRVTVYYDGQVFDFRSLGREIAGDDALIVGVYSPSVTTLDIREDMEFVMKDRRSTPNRQVRK